MASETTRSAEPAATMRRYVGVLLGALGLALALVLALNLILGDRGLGNVASTRAASLWQQATHGVTYAPPVGGTGPFKVLRLADRLPEINALVLGSSTLMGITQELFPADWRIYNLTVTGNSTAGIAGEAQYIARHWPDRVRWVLAGLDWSVGNIYLPGKVTEVDLSPDAVARAYASAANAIPLGKRLEDALSWPRVANLGSIVTASFKNSEPLHSLRQTFFDLGGAEYRCADGTLARDFDVINRGLCRGYRYDGSWTFANDSRLTPAQAVTLANAAAAPSSKYTKHLCATQGEPNAEYLKQLGETAQRLAANGGRMIFMLPPLAPGMEQTLRNAPRWKTCLDRTKASLEAWAQRYQVSVIDAGASEHYGCLAAEFTDEHHAYTDCYRRVLQRFFRDLADGRTRAGLYKPEGA
jgi:hypothetical protein